MFFKDSSEISFLNLYARMKFMHSVGCFVQFFSALLLLRVNITGFILNLESLENEPCEALRH